MSRPLPSTSPTASGTGPRRSAAALLDRATRLAIMVVLVAFGLMLLGTFREILHDSPTASGEKGARGVEAAPPESQAVRAQTTPDSFVFQPGVWSLGDSSWALFQRELSSPSDQERLTSLGSRMAVEPKPSPLEEKLLVWIHRLRPTVVDGYRVYNTSYSGCRVRLVTEKQAGRERLRLAQLVWTKGRSMQLLELSPAPDLGAHKSEALHLLPLPPGVASLARRWDLSDHLSCELLGPASVQQCLGAWSADGWTSEKIATDGPFAAVLLRQGERRIQLCHFESGQPDLSSYLLLTTLTAEP